MRLTTVFLMLLSGFSCAVGNAMPPGESREALDRGVVARATGDGAVYVGWRLLESDHGELAFDVYRRTGEAEPVKLNSQPVCETTDFVDVTAEKNKLHAWFVRPVLNGVAGPPSREAMLRGADTADYISIRLEGRDSNERYTFQKVGIADLNGDRRFDFVIKQPNFNVDPWYKYWKRSPDTFKLDAYAHDGRLLWRHDLGWSIEQGIWYSPYVVYDLDGDGKAEVAVKTGEGDPRDKDGKVKTGPERLTILDGASGKPITGVDWPSREGFSDPHGYNYASRNQLGVAYLDGKTPAVIVERGTYNIIKLVAYSLQDGRLREIWRWDNSKEPREYWGQGAHRMQAADVDDDGRDELVIGSAVIDDDGKPLWSTGLGHPDHFYLGDIDPSRSGLEIYYGIEPSRPKNSMCLVDARTGKILWGHDERTKHIHSAGLCSDIDPAHPGSECYSGERDFKDKRWLRNSKGELLSTDNLGSLAPRAAYWDSDLQRELVGRGRIRNYKGPDLPTRVEGHIAAVADVLGDWREEIITSVPGELRIYTTTIPATDRRTCLMQDPIYRGDVISAATGYFQVPMTSYNLAASK